MQHPTPIRAGPLRVAVLGLRVHQGDDRGTMQPRLMGIIQQLDQVLQRDSEGLASEIARDLKVGDTGGAVVDRCFNLGQRVAGCIAAERGLVRPSGLPAGPFGAIG